MYDLLYSRYGSFADKVLQMGPEKGFRLYSYAVGQIREKRIFERWVHGYQFSIEYQEFRGRIMGGTEDVAPARPEDRTQEEILAKVKGIIGGGWHGDI